MRYRHEVNRLDCTSEEHCVIGMHHVKSLDTSVSVLHHGYGAWSRHNGSIQLVWCPHLPILTSPIKYGMIWAGPIALLKSAPSSMYEFTFDAGPFFSQDSRYPCWIYGRFLPLSSLVTYNNYFPFDFVVLRYSFLYSLWPWLMQRWRIQRTLDLMLTCVEHEAFLIRVFPSSFCWINLPGSRST